MNDIVILAHTESDSSVLFHQTIHTPKFLRSQNNKVKFTRGILP